MVHYDDTNTIIGGNFVINVCLKGKIEPKMEPSVTQQIISRLKPYHMNYIYNGFMLKPMTSWGIKVVVAESLSGILCMHHQSKL